MDVFRVNERIAMHFHKPGEPETVMNEIAQKLSDEDVETLVLASVCDAPPAAWTQSCASEPDNLFCRFIVRYS